MSENFIVAVAGAGSMGSGIAQVAATAGHRVILYDNVPGAAEGALKKMAEALSKLVEKGKLSKDRADAIWSAIQPADSLKDMAGASLFIEAIVENLEHKKDLFKTAESLLTKDAILATNTSSLSVTAIASACADPSRCIGLHFFNPAQLMPLVEVIPAVQTEKGLAGRCVDLMKAWGKVPVIAKDTPGFIVNRLARPFYGESLRILEEGIADIATIDWALKSQGGFKMGPFELMDLIGNDINYTVTETVWTQMYYDPRYKPSLIQKKMMEAGRLGRKSGRGYYDYTGVGENPGPVEDIELARSVFMRVLCMLINESAEALHLKVASRDELDLAVTRGVNYPKGLLAWADEIGIARVLETLDGLYAEYGEDRYRSSVLLKRYAGNKLSFY
ncbi:MAG: 3-hydroxybutyryl-CoA dehydrogenase [Bacteroidia bacterium]|nr:3-hydroxybutyryl-CoA dehydrogenase [Bacteroidia bacterium]